ncbi:MAG: hypothetical protein AAF614_22370 [Chloroflexota bacterium]
MLARKHSPAKTYHIFVVGWMLLAILTPLYAPWLNSNYAALQPGHKHLYQGKPNLDHHTSPLEELLPHAHEAEAAEADEVTNLPNLDAAGGTAVLVLVSLLLIPFAVPLTHFYFFRERSLGVTLFSDTPPNPPPRLVFSPQF